MVQLNYKCGMYVLIGALVLILTYCIGFSVGSQKRPVYNRVYTSDHKSIEKALRSAGVDITHEQLESMYRSVKNDR